ncbi:MAG: glycosyltransferase family 4 protein [Verrucomicrobiota bacterium JB023]|nr:glycosyltransferase family 4 protein [Verrucomicrobiota bacterium JB023]
MTSPTLILGNSNRKFSGVTSTMLQTLPHLRKEFPLAILGEHHVPADIPVIHFGQLLSLGRRARAPLLFHARRNDEMLQALLAKKLGAKLKIVFTSTAQRYHSRLTKELINRMDGLITTCSGAASYLHRPADMMIPHGVDLQRYHPAEDKRLAWRALGLPGDYGIGIFGRIRPQKGTHLLVRSAIPLLKKNPKPTIVIVGETLPRDASFQSALENEVREAGLSDRIIFLGKQPFDRLPELFRALHLVTALSDNEGFGLTVLEAFASGTAVLATRAGAWADIVSPGIDGELIPVKDERAVEVALRELLQHPSQLIEMGQRGREKAVADYSIEREVAALSQFYRRFLPPASD